MTDRPPDACAPRDGPGLVRVVSMPMLVFYGLGNILGAGIYVLIGEVAGAAGTLAPASFLVASLLVVPSALAYAELSARYPVSAGESVYLFEAFGARWLSIAVGLLLALAGTVSTAALARGFAGYLSLLVDAPTGLVVVLLVAVLGGVCAWGIGVSVKLAAALTLVEIAGLALVLYAGGGWLLADGASETQVWPEIGIGGFEGVLIGAVLAFFAFLGFEDMVNVAEEVRDPERSMPRAIVIALVVATVLYAGVAVVAVLIVPAAELAASSAPLADVYARAGGPAPGLLVAIGLTAVINGALVQIIMSSRIIFGMSRRGWLPARFGTVAARTRTPILATVLVTGLVAVFAVAVPLKFLAWATSLIILVVFNLVNLALWRIKRRATPGNEGRLPRWVPLAGAVSSAAFAVAGLVLIGAD